MVNIEINNNILTYFLAYLFSLCKLHILCFFCFQQIRYRLQVSDHITQLSGMTVHHNITFSKGNLIGKCTEFSLLWRNTCLFVLRTACDNSQQAWRQPQCSLPLYSLTLHSMGHSWTPIQVNSPRAAQRQICHKLPVIRYLHSLTVKWSNLITRDWRCRNNRPRWHVIQCASAVESILQRHMLVETTGHFHRPWRIRMHHADRPQHNGERNIQSQPCADVSDPLNKINIIFIREGPQLQSPSLHSLQLQANSPVNSNVS